MLLAQLIHVLSQYTLDYYMWAYNGTTRPPYSMIIVGLAIGFGCGTGIAEGCMNGKSAL